MNVGDRFISELLDTKLVEEGTYRGERVFSPNPRTIYGGELMAQALVAASKTVPNDYKAHSLHCYFHDRCKTETLSLFTSAFADRVKLGILVRASVKRPNDYRVTCFRDSRSFSHRLVEAFPAKDQINGDSLAFFRMDCSFKAPENDPACFVTPMPRVPAADQVPYVSEFVKSLEMDKLSTVSKDRIKVFLSFDSNSPMDIKICEPEYLLGLKSNPTGRLHAWIRLKQAPGIHSLYLNNVCISCVYSVPLEPYRDAILVYFSDAVLLWSAITEPHPINYLVTLNQSVWFHNPFLCPEPDDWVLFETRANYVGDALTLSYGAMWNAEGQLLASVAQQGLMRTQPLTPVSSANGLLQYDNGHSQ
ncbi:acyl-CoA thioesterase 8 [Paragonimus westermani]|uniref:Acyl-CoA thioesterase 8 n=1 Tax=Paragonimus westermani TaxID=34504 RepID=A0A5J4NII4_9TREM|nr:acyl-CoA thioesterase 8 [Paragonimus westermani]